MNFINALRRLIDLTYETSISCLTIILLHGKTHFCDFLCHLFHICDLTVVSHNVFRSKPAPTWPYHVCCPSWACLLCRGLTHGNMLWGAPWAQIPSEIHLLRHRHNCDNRCFEMYLLWRGLTDTPGCLATAWTHPKVTLPLTQVHTGVPACPVQRQ